MTRINIKKCSCGAVLPNQGRIKLITEPYTTKTGKHGETTILRLLIRHCQSCNNDHIEYMLA